MTPGRRFLPAGIAQRTRRRTPVPATSSWPSASALLRVLERWCGPPGRPPASPSATPGWSSPPGDVAHVLWHLPQHWSDPAVAWPAPVRGPLPGPAGMYASFTGLVGGLSGGTAAVLRHLPGRAAGHRPGHPRSAKHAAAWAGGRELRLLTVGEPKPGRVILGHTPGTFGRLLAAEDCHSAPPAATRPPPWSSPPSWNGPGRWSRPA